MSSITSALIKAIRFAAVFNPEVQVAPVCILWPDRDRQWEAVIPRLQNEMPELLVLGDYDPERKTGPAIWLRCVIARTVDGIPFSEDLTPILYLPGVSRQDLRAVESCPEYLKPLAELQYRGVIWSQVNAKDWTILAFLKSDQGGLGLDVARDKATLSAIQLSLCRLLDEEVEMLRGKRLDKDYFTRFGICCNGSIKVTLSAMLAGRTSGVPLWKSVNRNWLSILKTTASWLEPPGWHHMKDHGNRYGSAFAKLQSVIRIFLAG